MNSQAPSLGYPLWWPKSILSASYHKHAWTASLMTGQGILQKVQSEAIYKQSKNTEPKVTGNLG